MFSTGAGTSVRVRDCPPPPPHCEHVRTCAGIADTFVLGPRSLTPMHSSVGRVPTRPAIADPFGLASTSRTHSAQRGGGGGGGGGLRSSGWSGPSIADMFRSALPSRTRSDSPLHRGHVWTRLGIADCDGLPLIADTFGLPLALRTCLDSLWHRKHVRTRPGIADFDGLAPTSQTHSHSPWQPRTTLP